MKRFKFSAIAAAAVLSAVLTVFCSSGQGRAGAEGDIADIAFNRADRARWAQNIHAINPDNVEIEWVSNFGNTDSFSLKAHKPSDESYNSMANAIRLSFDRPLEKDAVYHISYSVYVPREGNHGKEALTGPGIVINGDYAGAAGVSKFPINPGTISMGMWREVILSTPDIGLESPLRSIDFRFVVNDGPNHPDVWFIDNIKVTQRLITPEEMASDFRDYTPIKDVYKDYFLIGVSSVNRRMVGERLDLIKYHFNALTPGNEMKPDYLQGVKGNFTFSNLDDMLSKVDGMNIIGHTLAWHSQSPAWMWGSPDALPYNEAKANLENHIEAVLGRYGGNMYSMDVINEALTDGTGNPADWRDRLRKTEGWYRALGADWIEIAFVKAAEVADRNRWNVKLYYNDYNLDSDTKSQAVYNMVRDINERNARRRPGGKPLIEGIGMQAHYSSGTAIANVERSINRFSALPGVSISITELDVNWRPGNSTMQGSFTPQEEEAQARMYARLMDLFKRNAAGPANNNRGKIERVTFWGTDDFDSWRAHGYPLPFDRFLRGKEALKAVLNPDAYK